MFTFHNGLACILNHLYLYHLVYVFKPTLIFIMWVVKSLNKCLHLFVNLKENSSPNPTSTSFSKIQVLFHEDLN
jgi:hypothetical protein